MNVMTELLRDSLHSAGVEVVSIECQSALYEDRIHLSERYYIAIDYELDPYFSVGLNEMMHSGGDLLLNGWFLNRGDPVVEVVNSVKDSLCG